MIDFVVVFVGIILAVRLIWRQVQLRRSIIVSAKIVDVETKGVNVVGDVPRGVVPPGPRYQLLTIRFRDPTGSYRSVALSADGFYHAGQDIFVVIDKDNGNKVDYYDPKTERTMTIILIALFAVALLIMAAAKFKAV